MKTIKKLSLITFLSATFALISQGATTFSFVIGDAFPQDGSGNINSPSGGTNGNSGNTIDTVYQVTTGQPGNPFNGGNPGGAFSPLSVGNIFGTDYRSTLDFNLSGLSLPPAPAGQSYVVSMVELFLEVSNVATINGASLDLDIFSGLGVTAGPLNIAPDATFNIPNNSALNGNFLPGISLPTSTLPLSGNAFPSNFPITLDVANPNQGITLGSSLSTAANPNVGINGTNFAQVAPRLLIEVELIPEPTSVSLLSLFSFFALTRRKRA